MIAKSENFSTMPPIFVIGHQLPQDCDIQEDKDDLPEGFPTAHFSLTSMQRQSYEDKLQKLYQMFEISYQYNTSADRVSVTSVATSGSFSLDPNRHSVMSL